MRRFRSLSAGPLGLAATAAFAIGLTATGPALVGTAHAAPNAGSAFIANNTLTIVGTDAPDVVSLEADATEARVTFAADPANVHHFNLTDFTSISVSLGNGDDVFTQQSGVLTDKPTTVDGGNGNDSLKTGDAVDVINGGSGNDRVDAGKGNDRVSLDNGDDFFVWNPGQGSDAVEGGNGNDVMQFNGAAADEVMSLSANGPRAVFLRTIGAATVVMDTNGVEVVNVAALGGKDSITVNDVAGTSIRHANIDLSGPGGGADGAADVVTVNGTDRADVVNVTAEGGVVDVAGLQAETRITGSNPDDHLQVNTADGNDRVTVPFVNPLIDIGVDLGPGQV